MNSLNNPAQQGETAARDDNRVAKMLETYNQLRSDGCSYPTAAHAVTHGHRNRERVRRFLELETVAADAKAYMATVQI